MVRISFTLFFLYLMVSCTDTKKGNNPYIVNSDTLTVIIRDAVKSIDIDKTIDRNIKKSESFFYTQRIDLTDFVRLKKKYDIGQPAYVTMTDFDSVSLLLDGIVIFRDGTKDPERFNFRNGQSLECLPQDDCFFVAYYPEFDILRLEGGHTTDLAYNLTTGDSIENIGLPPYMKYSPNKEYLFNGYYSGQAFDFFIQQKQGNTYKTLGYIDWNYDYIRDCFWINDSTLCLDIPDLDRFLLLTIKKPIYRIEEK